MNSSAAFKNSYNVMDQYKAMTVDQINLLETCAAQGLLLSWVKVLYFMKGTVTGSASCYLRRICLLVLPSF